MTQKENIIQILNQSEWVCGIVFQSKYTPEYRTRINELRKDGFTVEARRCTQHPHKGMGRVSELMLVILSGHIIPMNSDRN